MNVTFTFNASYSNDRIEIAACSVFSIHISEFISIDLMMMKNKN